MENIDDLMRQKFDADDPQERFEFQEEYWDKALALLEKDEEKRRRKWWLFIGLFLAIALLLWCLFNTSGWLSHHYSNNLPSGSGIEKTDSKTIHPLDPSKEKASESIPNTVQNSNIQSEQSETETAGLRKKSANEPAGKPNRKSGFRKQEGFQHSESMLLEENLKKQPMEPNSATGQALVKVQAPVPANGLVPAADSGISGAKLGENSIRNPDRILPAAADSLANISKDKVAEGDENEDFRFLPIFNIQTPLVPFSLPLRSINLRSIPAIAGTSNQNPIKPVQSKKLSLGFSLAGSAYKAAPNGRWTGYTGGVYGRYRIHKNWSAMLGIQWRALPGYQAAADSSNPVVTEQLRFSFGYRRELWQRETQAVHYLEIPLSGEWEKGRFGLEAGASAGWLLTVQESLKTTTQSSLEPAVTKVQKFVKGDVEPYKAQYFTAFAGLNYRLNSRISLMAHGQYRFTPLFNQSSEGVKNPRLANLDLGLRFRLY